MDIEKIKKRLARMKELEEKEAAVFQVWERTGTVDSLRDYSEIIRELTKLEEQA